MGGGGEFDAIRQLLASWGPLADGIGDDAAVLAPPIGEQLIVSTDASLEDVHFRASWLSAEEIGARAAAAALSDIAAMGARALSVLVALEVPAHWHAQLAALASGIGRVVGDADARIVGGNITRGDRLGITLTVIGASARPVYRRGALPGDSLWVTGHLGGPGAALRALLAGDEPTAADRARFASPVPRLREGAWLAAVGAHAMLDISDGLSADAGHLAAASGVTCELWLDALPLVTASTPTDALGSGEEYELLVATAPDLDADGFARRFGVPLTRIGVVRERTEAASPLVMLRQSEGAIGHVHVALPAGHDHFSV
jgi:thiamine-monophosphate kinase